MKKLLLSLMVLATLASCGKSNKVDTGAGKTTSPSTVVTPPVVTNDITISDATAIALGGYINSSETSFAQAPTYYLYYVYITNTTSYNCEEKEGWFGIDYTKCTNDSNSVSSKVLIKSVDLATKRKELRDIVNASSAGNVQANGSAYYIRTTDGSLYVIDRKYPLQANPVSVQLTDGKIKYFSRLN